MPDFRIYLERVREFNPGLTVREAGPDDGPAFVKLFNSYYNRKTNLEYFKWQFFDSPFDSRLFVAVDEGRLAGMYGIKLYPLTSGASAGFAVDFLIEEPYRKKGIAYLLEDEVVDFCRQNGAAVLSALPNASGNAAFKALGWRSVAKIDSLLYELPGSKPYEAAIDVDTPAATPGIAFLKNDGYRKWRYDHHPTHHYDKISPGGDIFAITKNFSNPFDGRTYCDIVEISARCSAKELNELIKFVTAKAKKENMDALATWALPHTALFSMLTFMGFRPVPQERYFCLKLADPGLASLYDVENWVLSQIDAEIY